MTKGHLLTAAGAGTAPAAAVAYPRPEDAERRMAGTRRRDGPPPDEAIRQKVEQGLERHAEVLRGLVEASGRSPAEIEGRLGWPPGRLRRWLGRPQELEYHEIMAVLEALGVTPMEFFALVASPETEH